MADQNQKPKVLEAALMGLLYEKAKRKKVGQSKISCGG